MNNPIELGMEAEGAEAPRGASTADPPSSAAVRRAFGPRWAKAALLLAPLALGGCAALTESPVPGSMNAHPLLEPVTESQILAALRCQIARGFAGIEALKQSEEFRDHPLASGVGGATEYNIVSGAGILSGSEGTHAGNTARLSVSFPFVRDAWPGTTATPNIDGGVTANRTEAFIRTFQFAGVPKQSSRIAAFETALTQTLTACVSLEQEGYVLGDFVENAMIASARSLFEVPPNQGLALTATKYSIRADFTVAKSVNGGTGFLLVPAGPGVNSISPALNGTYRFTEVFSLTLDLSTREVQTADTRRLIFCTRGLENELCIEGPYSDAQYEIFQSRLTPAARAQLAGVAEFANLRIRAQSQTEGVEAVVLPALAPPSEGVSAPALYFPPQPPPVEF